MLLDAEIMPWNLKAKELISNQYAHVAENAILDRIKLKGKIEAAVGENNVLPEWLAEYEQKVENAMTFKEASSKNTVGISGMLTKFKLPHFTY